MVEPWDALLIKQQPPTSLVGIAQQGRLVRQDSFGAARVDLSWVDETALALIDLAVTRRRDLCLVYPAPAGEVSVLLAAELLLKRFATGDPARSVGIVTADATLAAKTWEELKISTQGDRVPIADVFPSLRASPNGESPLGGRGFDGVLVGERSVGWSVDVLIEDHLAGPVSGEPGRLTIAIFADPLDQTLARRADQGALVWGWAEEDLARWNAELESGADVRLPFSVAHDRLATIARGVEVTIDVARHPLAEAAGRRVREDLRLLREVAGPMPQRVVARGLGIAWHHFQTLSSLPCRPSQFDRFCGVPPWAPRSTATFVPEIMAWAALLPEELTELAQVLASDLADFRAALDEGHPFLEALEAQIGGSVETVVVTRTRAAARALLDALGGDPNEDRIGQLATHSARRLNRLGACPRAIALGGGARWDWHRLDSGLTSELHVLVLGDEAAAEGRRILEMLARARARWGGPDVRGKTWRALVHSDPPPTLATSRQPDRKRIGVESGPEFVAEPDPFADLDSLLDGVPLQIGSEGLEDRLARQAEDGRWSASVSAIAVTTEAGRILLEVGRPIEVRIGRRIVDRTPDQLEPGMSLLIGRQRGRLGLLEALEQRLRHRRPDLLVARLLIESYHQLVRPRFAESGLSYTALWRLLRAAGCDKTVFAVRAWVTPDGALAPRDVEDLRRLDEVLQLDMGTQRINEVFGAVQRRRVFRRAAGRVLAEAARSSTVVADHSRVDSETGLSVADLKEAVIEAVVVSVDESPIEVPLTDVGQLEEP